MINGLSWPATERLTYRRAETVRWRVVNLSSQTHPMHLRGFYFTVTHTGDGRRDDLVDAGRGRQVMTQMVPSGGTMTMEWTPEREGRWLFHCHIMHHVSPDRRIGTGPTEAHGHEANRAHADASHDASLGMAGTVLGVTVLPSGDAPPTAAWTPSGAARQLTLILQPTSVAAERDPGVGIAVVDASRPAGEAPSGSPGPPRAGTFIHHTHLHDYRQLTAGLYGPLIVTEPGETFDPSSGHPVVIGRRNASETSRILQEASSVEVNGAHTPRLVWRAGARHRIRLIDITPDDIFTVSLTGRRSA